MTRCRYPCAVALLVIRREVTAVGGRKTRATQIGLPAEQTAADCGNDPSRSCWHRVAAESKEVSTRATQGRGLLIRSGRRSLVTCCRGLDPVELAPAAGRIAHLLAAAPPIEFPDGLAPPPAPVDPAPLPDDTLPRADGRYYLDCGRAGRTGTGTHPRCKPAALASLHPPFRGLPKQDPAPCAGGHVPASGQLLAYPRRQHQRVVHQVRAAPQPGRDQNRRGQGHAAGKGLFSADHHRGASFGVSHHRDSWQRVR